MNHEFKIKKAALNVLISMFSVLLKAEKWFYYSSDVLEFT